ncbi:MAG: hypothetical protein AMJ79_14110 [Phycisphaerae bacterium SM23_30]|nr:MAG: hypothetical protein AMJ79_14110 [Phycisphaerae bacterium SM23_30]
MRPRKTLVHVTHEATRQIGGIGAVLRGLLTCRSYQAAVERSIIIGPLFGADDSTPERLGSDGKVLYSSRDGLTEHPYAAALAEVERKFRVSVVYGRRTFYNRDTRIKTHTEVILIDVTHADLNPVNALKAWMYEEFGIESDRYEHDADYQQYVKLAPAALATLHAVGASDCEHPSILIGHEYMGLPTILAAVLDPLGRFKTIYYAHEVPTARRLVEDHPGHDTMFYNIMNLAWRQKYYLPEIFGAQKHFFKYALVSAARYCDNIIAVGDNVVRELRWRSPEFESLPIDLVYNGLEKEETTLPQKKSSKDKLRRYAQKLLGFTPDLIFTHICRLTISKGLWRDLRVLEHLDRRFQQDGRTAVFFLLSTDAPRRRRTTIYQMEQNWDWPVAHREGLPDLSGAEAAFYAVIQAFNIRTRNIKAVLVNQFGWDRQSCGVRMPSDMEFADLRRGTDVEFGQSIYEPFGISQLEPLEWGGLCVVSSVCGCLGFVRSLTGSALPANVIVADYTHLDGTFRNPDLKSLLEIDRPRRDIIEHRVAAQTARTILQNLPQTDARTEALIQKGAALAGRMNWNVVCQKYFLPALDRAYHNYRARQTA